ncbi:MAG TPA: hypothetical protein VIZ18_09940 [Ktedonobacteraceae bacterium]
MNVRRFTHIIMVIGLLLVLTSCTESPSLPAGLTPTVKASTSVPTGTGQPSPAPTPSPFGGASAQPGPLPQACPLSSIRKLQTISTEFAPEAGAGPAWAGGMISYKQVPIALVWAPGDALAEHNQYGWGHKLLWVVATTVHGSVTIHGTNLKTGAPVYPDAEYAENVSTPTALVLDPGDPAVVSQDANRDGQWTQFPGGLTVPGAGCYSLEAMWPGGNWQMTFAAGMVPG